MVYGIIAVVVFILFWWMVETSKAAKDPDVIEASELGIPIWRYRKYKEAWDKIQLIYKTYGTQSEMSFKMADEIISTLPNMNEWRRFSDRQLGKTFDDWNSKIKENVVYNRVDDSFDRYKNLFDKIKENGLNATDDIRKQLTEIAINDKYSSEWKSYCLTRQDEIRQMFKIGSIITVLVDDDKEVKGEITSYRFSGWWFTYDVLFEKAVGFNNSFPREEHSFTERDIINIISRKLQGSFIHMIIKHR